MSRQDFNTLYEKFLSGKCTEEDRKLLDSYFDEIKLLDDEWEDILGDKQRIEKSIRNRINTETGINTNNVFKPVSLKRAWLKYAAIILIFITIAGLISLQHWFHWQKQGNDLSINKKGSIKPGLNLAYLTLANGTSIVISNKANGVIAKSSGASVNKISDSVLAYTSTGNHQNNTHPDSNQLSVPRGGVFQTVLSDGTKIWLNSASSLKYPVAFAGTERRVVLSGEAYFEVAKNKHMPFKVCVNGMDIKVLGTHFNVMAYHDEDVEKITLLEGSVKLESPTGRALLIPGQQGSFAAGSPNFVVKPVNTADVVAWKDGYFIFDNVPLHDIMKSISRWYNVDVFFKDNINSNSFGGTISRSQDIRVVLEALEETGSVHFKIEGRRVIVMD
jgi:transmembrane sensor